MTMHTIHALSPLCDVNTIHGNSLHWNVVHKRVLIYLSGLHHRGKVIEIEREPNYGEIHTFFQLFSVEVFFHYTLAVKMC